MRWLGLLTLTAACGFRVSGGDPGDAPLHDAPLGDSPTEGPSDGAGDAPADSGPSTSQIMFVAENHAQRPDSGHDNISTSLPPPVAGHSYIVVVSWYTPTVSVDSITDTAGNAYAFAHAVSNGTISQAVYAVARTNTTSSDLTVTATWTGHAQFCEIRVLEYAGLAASNVFDKASSGVGANGPTMTTGAVQTARGNELLLASFTGTATGPGSMYAQRMLFVGDLEEDRVVLPQGSYAATAAAGSGSWIGQLTAFYGQ